MTAEPDGAAAVATITRWPSLRDTAGEVITAPWRALFAAWCEPRRFAGNDQHPGWSAGRFDPPQRRNENVRELCALVLDYDSGASLADARVTWAGSFGFLHTTRRHAPEAPRFRVILPFSRAVTPEEYALLWQWGYHRAGEIPDKGVKDPARFWYQPGGEHYHAEIWEGSPVDVASILRPQPAELAAPPVRAASPVYARAALSKALGVLSAAGRGERNTLLAKEAFSMGGFVASGALDYQEVYDALLNATGGWDAQEVGRTRATLQGQFEAGMRAPRTAPAPRAASSSGPRKWGVGLEHLVTATLSEGSDEAAAPAPIDRLPQVFAPALAEPLPPFQWLCRELGLLRGRPLMFSGYGDVGKTFAAQELLLAVAAGRSVCWGGVRLDLSGTVIHLDFEQQIEITRWRYQRLCVGNGVDLAALGERLSVISLPPVYLCDAAMEALLEVKCTGATVCLVDNLCAGSPGVDENTAAISAVLYMLNRVTARTGCIFIVVHHETKDAPNAAKSTGNRAQKVRGHSSIHAAIGGGCSFRKEDDLIVVEQTKASMGVAAGPVRFRLVDVEEVDENTGKSRGIFLEKAAVEDEESEREESDDSKVTLAKGALLQKLIDHGPTPKMILKSNVGYRKDIVWRALRDLELAGVVIVSRGARGTEICSMSGNNEASQ